MEASVEEAAGRRVESKQKGQGLRGAIRLLRAHPEFFTVPLVLVVAIVGWEAYVELRDVSSFLIAKPTEIVEALDRGFTDGPYLNNLWITLQEMLLGFVLGSLVALVLGGIIAQSRLIESTAYPYVIAFQAIPKVAIAPLFIIWFGFGITSKIYLTALIVFFPVLVNTIEGLRSTEQERIELLKAMCASGWQIFWKVKFRNALPFIFAGLNIAIVFAPVGAVVAEFVGAQHGLGILVLQSQLNLDIPGTFAVLVILGALGVAGHLIIVFLRRRLVFWAGEQAVTGT